jgi:hypothetical protein
MIRRLIVPDGWPCTLEECRPGMFVTLDLPDLICFKSEYTTVGKPDAYNSGGEYFCDNGELIQPVILVSEEE